ncbi:hypothetical protein [Nostoc sp. FACHB-110]|uniref:hypothetical protein n=1 Tax=Nostoc sp. FACHB-110 TaxID=2692834 RepID=UPI0016836845|nr:hypothetical protein [Nostoc sp. FACHB-110]MBD2441585.1 hypothetical protein [Nostoc sp. FACHB-110]
MVKWLEQLRRWIKRLFRQPQKRSSYPRIIKRWDRNNTAVLRIERNTPGEVATYRITSLYGSYDFLLTLDYLPELHAELVGEFDGTTIRLGRFDHPSNPATHRFAVWCVWHNGYSRPIGIWDCDLQGYARSALREIAPKRAVFGVALRALQVIHSTKTPAMSWQSQMERMDWLGLLEERIRGELSSPNHNLKSAVVLRQT